jgi:hypothetical protein
MGGIGIGEHHMGDNKDFVRGPEHCEPESLSQKKGDDKDKMPPTDLKASAKDKGDEQKRAEDEWLGPKPGKFSDDNTNWSNDGKAKKPICNGVNHVDYNDPKCELHTLAQNKSSEKEAEQADDKARKEVAVSSGSTIRELPEHTEEKVRNGNGIKGLLKGFENPFSKENRPTTDWTNTKDATKPICNGKNRGECESGTLGQKEPVEEIKGVSGAEKVKNGNSIKAIIKEGNGSGSSGNVTDCKDWTETVPASQPICNGKNRGECEPGTFV